MKTVLKSLIILGGLTLASCDKQNPVITLNVDKTTASVGEAVNIEFGASDNKKIQNYYLFADLYSADSVFIEQAEVARDEEYNSKDDFTSSYQYTIPATTASGDSITPGFYIEFIGGALDKRNNGTPSEKHVSIQ